MAVVKFLSDDGLRDDVVDGRHDVVGVELDPEVRIEPVR